MFNIGISRRSLARFGFEGMLIVAGILIAFSIDAGWDEQQEERQRAELIRSLQQDFSATRGRLESAIARRQWAINRLVSGAGGNSVTAKLPRELVQGLDTGSLCFCTPFLQASKPIGIPDGGLHQRL